MAKVFESEISVALHRLEPAYIHKCPDHPHAIPDKLDFIGVFARRGFGVEAKETTNREDVATSVVTPNQRAAGESIEAAGGLAIVVINFDRIRGVSGRVGFAFAWQWKEIPWGDRFWIQDPRAYLIPRVPGGWGLDDFMRRML